MGRSPLCRDDSGMPPMRYHTSTSTSTDILTDTSTDISTDYSVVMSDVDHSTDQSTDLEDELQGLVMRFGRISEPAMLRFKRRIMIEPAMLRFKRRIMIEVERGCPSCHTPLAVVPVVVSSVVKGLLVLGVKPYYCTVVK